MIKCVKTDFYDGESNESDDEQNLNRIGDIPLEWYDEFEHVGYDIDGKRISRSIKQSAIDDLLRNADDEDAWRTITDLKNQRVVRLSDMDLEVIRRIRMGAYPNPTFNPDKDHPEVEHEDSIHPVNGSHPPKRRFIPSKWEGIKIQRLVQLIREGKLLPPQRKRDVESYVDLWEDESNARRLLRKKMPVFMPAPKMLLPGHEESYNCPEEYLLTEQEKEERIKNDPLGLTTFEPQKLNSMRKIKSYQNLLMERFERCLDLYLCPRRTIKKLNVDPESLLPKLPTPKDLMPFPTRISMEYYGHAGPVRCIASDSTGHWIATGSEDRTLRIWEVSTGREFVRIKFKAAVTAVVWNPVLPFLAVAAEEICYLVNPSIPYGGVDTNKIIDDYLKLKMEKDDSDLITLPPPDDDVEDEAAAETENDTIDRKNERKCVKWQAINPMGIRCKAKTPELKSSELILGDEVPILPDEADDPPIDISDPYLYKQGCRIQLVHEGVIHQLVFHHKGTFLAAISPRARGPSSQCIIHSMLKQRSLSPFKKNKGALIQRVQFDRSRPLLFVATQRSVKIYNLRTQQLVKSLMSGAKWIGSISSHSSGDHVVVGTYDRRCIWFDTGVAEKPLKTFRYHDKAVRQVEFHNHYPLLMSCSDDATIHILHAQVFADVLRSPLIIPVKTLEGGHTISRSFGILDCKWHPIQPWLFSAGADGRVILWV
eukprot:GHVL01003494.1.p1 GENE.GHVL01003494.1~~GHVL01003494.1.p1  ORF type:complete len:709 (+),score=93.93 GHVL01003494.1:34-2160(+)